MKVPWCIEVEFLPTTMGEQRHSEFFVVQRMIGDVKDLHLVVCNKDDTTSKVTIPRKAIAKVLMLNSKVVQQSKQKE